ncbi:MAG: flagellar hook protein [Verrucomicrobiales bacterium]|nr:flagellar hook protein [Verrucomicrobiales bacterium]
MDLGISGLASGFDWKTLVSQLADAERTPQTRLRTEQSKIAQQKNAYDSIKTQMGVLNNRLTTLKDPDLYNSRLTSVSDSAYISATATTASAVGSYSFNVTQLATSSRFTGSSDAGAPISATDDVATLVVSDAKLANTITAGTLTVNGKQITIASTDTLKGVFDKISTATSGAVIGTYSSSADKISLTSSDPIVLGSAGDSSNFFQACKLYNNGAGTITSSSNLGAVKTSSTIANSNLKTAVSDGGSGAGEFKINGVSISFDATTDGITDVLNRINNSAAGVNATYDQVNDCFSLTNKTTGDVGVALEDVTGNFLAATGLSGGSLTRGKNLLYTVNGGGQLVSRSNQISSDSSGISGLTANAIKEGSTTVTVASDSAKIKTAITSFISDYNKVQAMIDAQTSSTTDSTGKVTGGILQNDPDASSIAKSLRSTSFGQISGLSGVFKQISDFGIDTSGTDNSLSLKDSSKLDAALATDVSSVKDFFSNSTKGLAVSLASVVDKIIGDDGSLTSRSKHLTDQSTSIDDQVVELEKRVQDDKDRLTASFIAMESAQAKNTQQLSFLTKNFG